MDVLNCLVEILKINVERAKRQANDAAARLKIKKVQEELQKSRRTIDILKCVGRCTTSVSAISI